MKHFKIHPDFKFNGISYSKEALLELAYSLVKEGESYEKFVGVFIIAWFDDSSAITVFTSGSTGKPKHISLLKKQMVNSAFATGAYFKLQPLDKVLLCLSADFIAGKMMLVRAMVLGLEMYLVPPSSNPLQHNQMEFDFCAMVPLQVSNSLKKIDQINTLIIGGAPLSVELKEALQSKSVKAFETYGMTETITHIALKQVNNSGSNQEENVFTTLPDVGIAIDDRNCLVIDAPNVSKQTIITNDVVELLSNTQFKWLGRFDNVINSGGVKLFPEQVESILSKTISERFFVAGLPDEKLGQKLVMFLEGAKIPRLLSEIQNLENLSKYQIPKEIYFSNQFIETKSGKINRQSTISQTKY